MATDPSRDAGTVALCDDGSPAAAYAIARAGELFPHRRAVVIHAWTPFRSLWSAESGWPAIDDGPMRLVAARVANRGRERALAAGFDATSAVVEARNGVAEAILEAADEAHASVIVAGTRGLSGVRSLLLGSISHAIAQHARCPVVIVPQAELARVRVAASGAAANARVQ